MVEGGGLNLLLNWGCIRTISEQNLVERVDSRGKIKMCG